MLQRTIHSHKGFSLIQVMVSVGVASIVITTMMMMQATQVRETRALSEKIAALDLERNLVSILGMDPVCLHVLNQPSPLTFNALGVTPATPQVIVVNRPIPLSVTGGVPGPNVVEIGGVASPYSSNIVVEAIELVITSGAANSYMGYWRFKLDQSRLARPMKPPTVSANFTVNVTNPGAAVFESCSQNTGPDMEWGGAYWTHPISGCSTSNPYTGGCSCPAGFVSRVQFAIQVGGCRPCMSYYCYKP